MDVALSDAWAYGTENHFFQVLYLIQSENVPVDYQVFNCVVSIKTSFYLHSISMKK